MPPNRDLRFLNFYTKLVRFSTCDIYVTDTWLLHKHGVAVHNATEWRTGFPPLTAGSLLSSEITVVLKGGPSRGDFCLPGVEDSGAPAPCGKVDKLDFCLAPFVQVKRFSVPKPGKRLSTFPHGLPTGGQNSESSRAPCRYSTSAGSFGLVLPGVLGEQVQELLPHVIAQEARDGCPQASQGVVFGARLFCGLLLVRLGLFFGIGLPRLGGFGRFRGF